MEGLWHSHSAALYIQSEIQWAKARVGLTDVSVDLKTFVFRTETLLLFLLLLNQNELWKNWFPFFHAFLISCKTCK